MSEKNKIEVVSHEKIETTKEVIESILSGLNELEDISKIKITNSIPWVLERIFKNGDYPEIVDYAIKQVQQRKVSNQPLQLAALIAIRHNAPRTQVNELISDLLRQNDLFRSIQRNLELAERLASKLDRTLTAEEIHILAKTHSRTDKQEDFDAIQERLDNVPADEITEEIKKTMKEWSNQIYESDHDIDY